QALVTGNTEEYIRKWYEVSINKIGFNCQSRIEAKNTLRKWFPYNKGGDFRNWYGNFEHVVNWENDGFELQNTLHPSGNRIWAHNFVLDSIFKESIVWSKITSGKPCFRYSPKGFLFDDASGVCTFNEGTKEFLIGLLCSNINTSLQEIINPTLNIQPANIRDIPIPKDISSFPKNTVTKLLEIHKQDWDSYETSWDMKKVHIFSILSDNNLLSDIYCNLL
ncbi:TPA: SAM-dependent methyltransferase, partial [Salmonella enterica subsp. enterica serovar Bahrenfeld]